LRVSGDRNPAMNAVAARSASSHSSSPVDAVVTVVDVDMIASRCESVKRSNGPPWAAVTACGWMRSTSRWSRTIAGMAFERITVNPERMGGKPCIRDLRVTVTMALGQLAGGRTIEQVLADYPYLQRQDVLAALEYAAAVVDQRELPLARPA
jgi:uncharacterized protein (DUF433 family)